MVRTVQWCGEDQPVVWCVPLGDVVKTSWWCDEFRTAVCQEPAGDVVCAGRWCGEKRPVVSCLPPGDVMGAGRWCGVSRPVVWCESACGVVWCGVVWARRGSAGAGETLITGDGNFHTVTTRVIHLAVRRRGPLQSAP